MQDTFHFIPKSRENSCLFSWQAAWR